jgi:hypothetical protein
MPRLRARASCSSTVLSVLVGLTLALSSRPSEAGVGQPEPPNLTPRLVPGEPSTEPEPGTEPEPEPGPEPGTDAELPGIEFAVPPPEDEDEGEEPEVSPDPFVAWFPDPGAAPSDGRNMLVLGATTVSLTIAGVTAALVLGIRSGVDNSWLLPSTIVPGVGLLAFGGGGLYLGIKRAREFRRWEVGYRVIGLPQGGGLMTGGSFTLLGALAFVPAGAFSLRERPELGWTFIGIGAAAAIATPIMFVVGIRNKRRYEATGGWKRKPIPPLPPGATTGALELRPSIMPLPEGGLVVGAGGRF